MTEVVGFGGVTRLDILPDRVLTAAVGKLSEVVICGIDEAGGFYFASSSADGGQTLWCLERAKWNLMQQADAVEAGDDA